MIEIISTGSELLSGRLNTNAAYIGEKLSLCGVYPSFITTVKDNKKDFNLVLKTAFDRASAVIITGGLGPTFDDITVECVAEFCNAPLIRDENVLKKMEQIFAERGYGEMPEMNKKQANIIKGAKVISNPNGTAPGQMFHFEYTNSAGVKLRKTVFLLPGPPREMTPMFEAAVLPFFKSYKADITKSLVFQICGLPESVIDEKISPAVEAITSGGIKVETAITAHAYVVSFKVIVSADDELLVDESLNNIKLEIEKILGDNVFGYNNDTLESVLGARLMKLNKKVAVAESCTGGLIAGRITNSSGASAYFGYGAVTYSNEAKEKILGVDTNTLSAHGAVSGETAAEMAEGILKLSGADYSIAVTGIAGPTGGTKEKPVGLVYIAIAAKGKGAKAYKNMFSGTRQEIRERAVNVALWTLLSALPKTK
jgi:nicotinamide-nucleotide amidase